MVWRLSLWDKARPLQFRVDGDVGSNEAVVTPGVEAVENCDVGDSLWLVCEDEVDLIFGLSNE